MKRLLVLCALAVGLVLGGAAPATADVNDFEFTSFDGHYQLSTDAQGHSELTTVETLVAVFPESDQNHGIRRNLVDHYNGHPTDLHIVSVTDEDGTPRAYETDSEDDFLSVTIAADDFVHGAQTYVITYTQSNVTRYFADTDADEFYWDTNGTDWGQPFGRVTATVQLADDLVPRLSGKVDAASGMEGADGPAEAARTADDTFTFSAQNLGPGENLTFAIGFEPGTFTPRDSGFFAAPWPLLTLLFAAGTLAAGIADLVIRNTRLRDAPGRGILIAEYLPPKGVNLLLSALILHRTSKSTAAQIIGLAVSGNLRIVEVTGRKPSYRLEFVSDRGTDADEREFLHALFGTVLTPGEHGNLKKTDQSAVTKIAALTKRVRSDATTNGYRRRPPVGVIALVVMAAALAVTGAIVFGAISLDQAYGGPWPAVLMLVAVLAAVTVGLLVFRVPLQPKGVELREHLDGLAEYIKLAEADRLRYLQSPQGALREPVATDNLAQVVKLNERLLPYAMLFGEEKRWAAELGRYYEQLGTQPGWYTGQGTFNAAIFASSIGAVSTNVSAAYSSSGGSGGGASSGGGGGGGGGGGV
ncbi:hypothetical protein GCM10027052_06920 [Parafrigoribacterium mesophilum]|uniref:DUF2207 domain-containing protein n=1 Tax=Parafrigoribacterium mesophilum TaxID=433646 RepID=UPI0031FBB922